MKKTFLLQDLNDFESRTRGGLKREPYEVGPERYIPQNNEWSKFYLYGAYFFFPEFNKLFIKVGFSSNLEKRYWFAKRIPRDPSLIISYYVTKCIGYMQRERAFYYEQKLFENLHIEGVKKYPHWCWLLCDGGSELYDASYENAIKIAHEIHAISKKPLADHEKRLSKMHILPEPSKKFITKKTNYQLFSQGMKAKIEYFSSKCN